jgi:hypothetical protein
MISSVVFILIRWYVVAFWFTNSELEAGDRDTVRAHVEYGLPLVDGLDSGHQTRPCHIVIPLYKHSQILYLYINYIQRNTRGERKTVKFPSGRTPHPIRQGTEQWVRDSTQQR